VEFHVLKHKSPCILGYESASKLNVIKLLEDIVVPEKDPNKFCDPSQLIICGGWKENYNNRGTCNEYDSQNEELDVKI
jgi:hypothetical protein